MDFRRIRVQDPSQSPLPFALPNKPDFWTGPWDNSLLPLCLDACITECKCAVTNTEINNLFSHKGGSRSSYFIFEILTSFGPLPWNKINRKWSRLACTQHLQLKHVLSGSQIPATTSAVRNCGGKERTGWRVQLWLWRISLLPSHKHRKKNDTSMIGCI